MDEKKEIIYTCQNRCCNYTFSAVESCEQQCPDCGKWKVREANEKEKKLFLERLNIKKDW